MSNIYDVKYNLDVCLGNSVTNIEKFTKSVGKLVSASKHVQSSKEAFGPLFKQVEAFSKQAESLKTLFQGKNGSNGWTINANIEPAKKKLIQLQQLAEETKAILGTPILIAGGGTGGSDTLMNNAYSNKFIKRDKKGQIEKDKKGNPIVKQGRQVWTGTGINGVFSADGASNASTMYHGKVVSMVDDRIRRAEMDQWQRLGMTADQYRKAKANPLSFKKDIHKIWQDRFDQTANNWVTKEVMAGARKITKTELKTGNKYNSKSQASWQENVRWARQQAQARIIDNLERITPGWDEKQRARIEKTLQKQDPKAGYKVHPSLYHKALTGQALPAKYASLPDLIKADNAKMAAQPPVQSIHSWGNISPANYMYGSPTSQPQVASGHKAGTQNSNSANIAQKQQKAMVSTGKHADSVKALIGKNTNSITKLANATERMNMQLTGVGGQGMAMTIDNRQALAALETVWASVMNIKLALRNLNVGVAQTGSRIPLRDAGGYQQPYMMPPMFNNQAVTPGLNTSPVASAPPHAGETKKIPGGQTVPKDYGVAKFVSAKDGRTTAVAGPVSDLAKQQGYTKSVRWNMTDLPKNLQTEVNAIALQREGLVQEYKANKAAMGAAGISEAKKKLLAEKNRGLVGQIGNLSRQYKSYFKGVVDPLDKTNEEKAFDKELKREQERVQRQQANDAKRAVQRATASAARKEEFAKRDLARFRAAQPFESKDARGWFVGGKDMPSMALPAGTSWQQMNRAVTDMMPKEERVYKDAQKNLQKWQTRRSALMKKRATTPLSQQEMHELRTAQAHINLHSEQLASVSQGWMMVDDKTGKPISVQEYNNRMAGATHSTPKPAPTQKKMSEKAKLKRQQELRRIYKPNDFYGDGARRIYLGGSPNVMPSAAHLAPDHKWVWKDNLQVRKDLVPGYNAALVQEQRARAILGSPSFYSPQQVAWAQGHQNASQVYTSGWAQEKIPTPPNPAAPPSKSVQKTLDRTRAKLAEFKNNPTPYESKDSRGWFIGGPTAPKHLLDQNAEWKRFTRSEDQLTPQEYKKYQAAKLRRDQARANRTALIKQANGNALTSEQAVLRETYDAQAKLAGAEMRAYRSGWHAVDKNTGQVLGQQDLNNRAFGRSGSGNLSYKLLGPTPLTNNGGMMVNMLKGMGVMYGISGVGSLISNIVSSSADYGNTMTLTRGILQTTDKDKETFGGRFSSMEKTIRDIGVKTKYTVTEVADAARFLAMSGMDVDRLKASMPHIANIALVGDTDLGETADLMTNVMSAYEIPTKQMARVSDIMTNTFSMSNVTLPEIAEAFKFSASLFKAGDVDFSEAVAGIGILGDAGIKGSTAGTSMRTILSNLVHPRGKAKQAAWKKWQEETGISIYNKDGKLNSLVEIFKGLTPDKVSLAEYYGLFDKTAAQAAVALGAHVDKWEAVTKQNKGSHGLAATRAEEMQNTVKGLWAQLTSAVTEAGLKNFQGSTENWIKDVLRDATAWVKSDEGLATFKELFEVAKEFLVALKDITAFYKRLFLDTPFGQMTMMWMKLQLAIWPVVKAFQAFKTIGLSVMGIVRSLGAIKNFGANMRLLSSTPGAMSGFVRGGIGGVAGGFSMASLGNESIVVGNGVNDTKRGYLYRKEGNDYIPILNAQGEHMKRGGAPMYNKLTRAAVYVRKGYRAVKNWVGDKVGKVGTGVGKIFGSTAGRAAGAIGLTTAASVGGMYLGEKITGNVWGNIIGAALLPQLVAPLINGFTLALGPLMGPLGILIAAVTGIYAWVQHKKKETEKKERTADNYWKTYNNRYHIDPTNPIDQEDLLIRQFELTNSKLLSEQERLRQSAVLWKEYHDAKNGPQEQYSSGTVAWADSEDNISNQALMQAEKKSYANFPEWTDRDKALYLTTMNKDFEPYKQFTENLKNGFDNSYSAVSKKDELIAIASKILFPNVIPAGTLTEDQYKKLTYDQVLQTESGRNGAQAQFNDLASWWLRNITLEEKAEQGYKLTGSDKRYLLAEQNPYLSFATGSDIGSKEHMREIWNDYQFQKKNGTVGSFDTYRKNLLKSFDASVEWVTTKIPEAYQQDLIEYLHNVKANVEQWEVKDGKVTYQALAGTAATVPNEWVKMRDALAEWIIKEAIKTHGEMASPYSSVSYSQTGGYIGYDSATYGKQASATTLDLMNTDEEKIGTMMMKKAKNTTYTTSYWQQFTSWFKGLFSSASVPELNDPALSPNKPVRVDKLAENIKNGPDFSGGITNHIYVLGNGDEYLTKKIVGVLEEQGGQVVMNTLSSAITFSTPPV